MKKVLAVLAVKPEYAEFAIPELKAILAPLQIPFSTLFSQSMPLPEQHYAINHLTVNNFPYVTLTVPNFDQHRSYFEMASKKAVMVSKFVLLISEGKNYEELLKERDEEILDTECRDWNNLVACDFVSRNRVIRRQDHIKKIHYLFDKMDIRGKIDIKNAKTRFELVEQHTWYHGHHESGIEETLERVFFGIELSSCKVGRAKFNTKYKLSERIYLGPTSADNDLAFLMCNQAKITQGSLVLDPFVGTAGLLIPPASQGALVFGCDLDMRVLNGYAVGRINKKSPYYSQEKQLETFVPKIFLSFDQYGFHRPNIIRLDSTKGGFAAHAQFDAIITDPPYGIRAMSRSMKKKGEVGEAECSPLLDSVSKKEQEEEHKKEGDIEYLKEQQTGDQTGKQTGEQKGEQKGRLEKTEQMIESEKMKKQKKKMMKKKKKEETSEEEIKFKQSIVDKLNKDRIENWEKFDIGKIEITARQTIFEGLLNLGRSNLKIGGRLVFLYPIYEEEKFVGIENLPPHDGFQVMDMSENILSSKNSRILVTLEKLGK